MRVWSVPTVRASEPSLTRFLISASLAGLMAAAPCSADAAMRKVRVPNQYDGAWTIVATTAEGPCSASTSYQVHIRASDASIPGDEIDIDGGVSGSGAVRATITKGSNKVPITGSLDPKGSGTGTWHTSGGLVACSGRWSAKRAG